LSANNSIEIIERTIKVIIDIVTNKWIGLLKFFKSYFPITRDINIQINEKAKKGMVYVGSTILIVAGFAHAKTKKEKLRSEKSKMRTINLLYL
jgi:hypothetical protein